LSISRQRTIRFDPDHYAKLQRIAKQQNRSIADLLRSIIHNYLSDQKALSASQLRQARLMEYTQAAVDTILREEHYDQRQLVIDETARRMERYHGA